MKAALLRAGEKDILTGRDTCGNSCVSTCYHPLPFPSHLPAPSPVCLPSMCLLSMLLFCVWWWCCHAFNLPTSQCSGYIALLKLYLVPQTYHYNASTLPYLFSSVAFYLCILFVGVPGTFIFSTFSLPSCAQAMGLIPPHFLPTLPQPSPICLFPNYLLLLSLGTFSLTCFIMTGMCCLCNRPFSFVLNRTVGWRFGGVVLPFGQTCWHGDRQDRR